MARPPVFPAEKVRIVLSILAGEVTVAEAARRSKVSEQSVGNWKRQFLESDRAGLVAGKSRPSTREAQLQAEVAELTQALGEAAVELRVWKKSAGPSSSTHHNRAPSWPQHEQAVELTMHEVVGRDARMNV